MVTLELWCSYVQENFCKKARAKQSRHTASLTSDQCRGLATKKPVFHLRCKLLKVLLPVLRFSRAQQQQQQLSGAFQCQKLLIKREPYWPCQVRGAGSGWLTTSPIDCRFVLIEHQLSHSTTCTLTSLANVISSEAASAVLQSTMKR